MPVLFSQQAGGPRTWVSIPPHEIKKLQKAIRDSAICSPYFKQLLKSTLQGHILTPNDCKNLASIMLTDRLTIYAMGTQMEKTYSASELPFCPSFTPKYTDSKGDGQMGKSKGSLTQLSECFLTEFSGLGERKQQKSESRRQARSTATVPRAGGLLISRSKGPEEHAG